MDNQDYQEQQNQEVPAYSYDAGFDSSDVDSETADKQATASMVCGIVGIVLCACGPLGVAALILGILAKKNGSTSAKAIAGIVMGAILVVLWIISLIIMYSNGGPTAYSEQMMEMFGG